MGVNGITSPGTSTSSPRLGNSSAVRKWQMEFSSDVVGDEASRSSERTSDDAAILLLPLITIGSVGFDFEVDDDICGQEDKLKLF